MKRKRILNVGCGNDTYGTDFIDLYPQRKEVIKCEVGKDKFPFPSETFDVVYSKCLLEHLRNVGFAISEMYRVLKKGGKLRIITDNTSYWYYALSNKTHTGRYEKKTKFGNEDRHYCLFTDQHLINHLEYFNMKKLNIKYLDNTGKGGNIKNTLVKIINLLLKFTPLWRMAYGRIEIVAEKV